MSGPLSLSTAISGIFNRQTLARFLTDFDVKLAETILDFLRDPNSDSAFSMKPAARRALSEEDTISKSILPLLRMLGFSFRQNHHNGDDGIPDVWLFDPSVDIRSKQDIRKRNVAILEAKAWNIDLSRGDSRTETPGEQICRYVVNNMSDVKERSWGILSNGCQWRLYRHDEPDKFIEFDLECLLYESDDKVVLGQLQTFATLFRAGAFLIHDGHSALSRYHQASLNSWMLVTDEMTRNGPKAFLELARGFRTTGIELTESASRAKIFLFRILFVLYMESKFFFPTGNALYQAISLRNILHLMPSLLLTEGSLRAKVSLLWEAYQKGGHGLVASFGGEIFEGDLSFFVSDETLASVFTLLTVYDDTGHVRKFMDYSSLNVELIGDIYEQVLGMDLVEVDDQVFFETQKSEKSTRAHQTGATYTVVEVVKNLVEDTIKSVSERAPTVVDPACGSGHFLVRALRRIDELTRAMAAGIEVGALRRREIVKQSIFGVDINPWAARLSRLMIAIETAHPDQPAYDSRTNILVFDSLLRPWKNSAEWLRAFGCARLLAEGGFDFVIGNPPYIKANEKGMSIYRKEISRTGQYTYLNKRWDIFVPFVELCFGLLQKKSGVMALVVSEGIAQSPYAAGLRGFLHTMKKLVYVMHFRKSFRGWAFPAVCFILNLREEREEVERRVFANGDIDGDFEVSYTKKPFLLPEKETSESIRQGWRGLCLADLFYVSVGMVLNKHESKFPDVDNFTVNDLVRDGVPDRKYPCEYLSNKNIVGGCKRKGARQSIAYGPGLLAPQYIRRATFPELHQGTRVLMKPSKSEPGALLVRDEVVVAQNTLVIKRWADFGQLLKTSRLEYCFRYSEHIRATGQDARLILVELSGLVTAELLVGVLLSSTFTEWQMADVRDKHRIMPDVLADFPFPLHERLPASHFDSADFGIKISNRLESIAHRDVKDAQAELLFLIEELVASCTDEDGTFFGPKQAILDELVRLLYRPVFEGYSGTFFDRRSVAKKLMLPVSLELLEQKEKDLLNDEKVAPRSA